MLTGVGSEKRAKTQVMNENKEGDEASSVWTGGQETPVKDEDEDEDEDEG